MFYVIPSGIFFGSLAYYLGRSQRVNQIISKDPKTVEKTEEMQTPKITQISSIPTNSFSPDAITPIIRTIEINPRCRIVYSTLHKSPLSVHQLLDLSVLEGQAERAKHFHTDPNIQPVKFAAKNDHYIKAGAFRNLSMTRGHMAAAGNYSGNQQLKNSTFSFANTVPQHGYNNGGIWNTFQRYCRTLLKRHKCDTLEIISGPIYTPNKILPGQENIYAGQQLTLLKNGVIIPARLYKIIKCNKVDKSYASGFTFLNEKTLDNNKSLLDFQYPIEEIEDETGLLFNFKENLAGKLSEYDVEGLGRSKLQYDRQFYSKLFEDSVTIDEMNNNLRRAQEQQIYLNEEKEKNRQKISSQARAEMKSLESNSDLGACNKIYHYLKLHRNLFYLGGNKGKYPDIQVQVEESVKREIPICKSTITAQDQRLILMQMSVKDRRYRFPARDELVQNFIQKETLPAQSDAEKPAQKLSPKQSC